jgi:hypothetical protein
MALTPLTERQKTLIVNNVIKAVKNIDSLNKTGYNYLYLCCGFIAHYNLYGFIAAYSKPNTLKNDLIANADCNQWRNFRLGERDYDYYMSKADVYNRILAQIA